MEHFLMMSDRNRQGLHRQFLLIHPQRQLRSLRLRLQYRVLQSPSQYLKVDPILLLYLLQPSAPIQIRGWSKKVRVKGWGLRRMIGLRVLIKLSKLKIKRKPPYY
jgi:hypothetical protein